MPESFILHPRKPALTEAGTVLYRRWREDLPNNDTFSLYYDLLSGRIDTEIVQTQEELAAHTHQCKARLRDSLAELEKKGYIKMEWVSLPKRTRKALQITLLDVDWRTPEPDLTPVPKQEAPVPVIPPPKESAPAPAVQAVALIPTEEPPPPEKQNGRTDHSAEWGNQPQKKVAALIDQVQGCNPKEVPPEIYAREVRTCSIIARNFPPDYVEARLRDILRYEPMWRNQRIPADLLLRKLPTTNQQRKDKSHGDENGQHARISLGKFAPAAETD